MVPQAALVGCQRRFDSGTRRYYVPVELGVEGAMAKLIVTVVESCRDCPNEATGSPGQYGYCQVNGEGVEMDSLPDWCSLDDVNEIDNDKLLED